MGLKPSRLGLLGILSLTFLSKETMFLAYDSNYTSENLKGMTTLPILRGRFPTIQQFNIDCPHWRAKEIPRPQLVSEQPDPSSKQYQLALAERHHRCEPERVSAAAAADPSSDLLPPLP